MKNIPSQFSWTQTSKVVNIQFKDKYVKFFWQASALAGDFPEMDSSKIFIDIRPTSIEIFSYQFAVPIFSGTFENPVYPGKWDYIPNIGIKVQLIKQKPDQKWNFPFKTYEKELYVKCFHIVNENCHKDLLGQYIATNKLSGKSKNSYIELFEKQKKETMDQFQASFNGLKEGFSLKLYLEFHKKFENNLESQTKECNLELLQMGSSDWLCDVSKKNSIFEDVPHKKLTPIFLSEMEFSVNSGKFVLVKASTNPHLTQSQQFVIEDAYENGSKVAIYNLDNRYLVKKGTWILIKEPLLKFGARDHVPMVRVDNPKDVIFFCDQKLFHKEKLNLSSCETKEQKERIENIEKANFKVMIFNCNIKTLMFTFMTFPTSSQVSEGGKTLFIQRNAESWVSADIDKEKKVSLNCIEIRLEKTLKSEIFLECIKHFTDKTPGQTFLLWRPTHITMKAFIEYLLLQNKMPLSLAHSLYTMADFHSKSLSTNVFESVYSVWEQVKDSIKCKNEDISQQNTEKNNYLQEIIVINQISQIVDNYKFILKQGRQLDSTHFGERIPFEIQRVTEEDLNTSLQPQIELLDAKMIFQNLIGEQDKMVVQNSIFYLEQYKKLLSKQIISKTDPISCTRSFANYVIEHKISLQEFNIVQAMKSLALIDFKYETEVINQFFNCEERNKLKEKTIERQQWCEIIGDSLFTPLQFDITILTDERQIEEFISQFDNEAQQEFGSQFDNETQRELFSQFDNDNEFCLFDSDCDEEMIDFQMKSKPIQNLDTQSQDCELNEQILTNNPENEPISQSDKTKEMDLSKNFGQLRIFTGQETEEFKQSYLVTEQQKQNSIEIPKNILQNEQPVCDSGSSEHHTFDQLTPSNQGELIQTVSNNIQEAKQGAENGLAYVNSDESKENVNNSSVVQNYINTPIQAISNEQDTLDPSKKTTCKSKEQRNIQSDEQKACLEQKTISFQASKVISKNIQSNQYQPRILNEQKQTCCQFNGENDHLSLRSLITVHSKQSNQVWNEHWKERLDERYNIDASNEQIKQEIILNLKRLLKDPGTIIVKSKRNPNIILVKDHEQQISFVLKKTLSSSDEKIVYIPITVLSQGMHFR